MRLSEFRIAMNQEFGEAYASTLARDLVLTDCGGLTVEAALSEGFAPRDVWRAVCEASDVPAERRHGVGLLPDPSA